MASNGSGVNLDASVPAVRVTWYDETHADFQNDGLGNYQMDLHKVWACMGRAGANGVVRAGFLEEGDPYTVSPACWIEHVAGGVASAANAWNALTGYCPHGGAAAGDFTVFGALSTFDGIALHLDTPLGVQPDIAIEYCTSASPAPFGTWAAAVVTRTPDFTQANGRALQRLELTPQASWPAIQLAGLAAPIPYYLARIRLVTGTGGPAAVANVNYKDWLYGYFKHLYCHYDLKKADDTAGTTSSSFKHTGFFGIRFRPGFGWTADTVIGDFQLGDKDATGKKPRPRSGWYSVSTKQPVMIGAKLYGGLVTGRARWVAETPSASIRSAANEGELIGTNIYGWAGQVTLGGTSSAGLKHAQNVSVGADDERIAANIQVMSNFGLISTGYSEGVVVDVPHGKSVVAAVRSTLVSATFRGIEITDDDVSTAQMWLTGTGYKQLFDMKWAGPNKKIDGVLSPTQTARDWRRLDMTVWEDGIVVAHPPAGIPLRITDSLSQLQFLGVFDSNGTYSQFSSMPNQPAVGEVAKNIIAVSMWQASEGATGQNEEDILDNYLFIEINPDDLAGYNSDYMTLEFNATLSRALVFDQVTQAFVVGTYQPGPSHIHVSLPKKVPQPVLSSEVAVEEGSSVTVLVTPQVN